MRFLLVHHSETPNTDSPGAIPARLRSMYAFHTRDKGWHDIAYNFLVDPYGGIWEGRTGSLAGPVRGDATGGSQGHALLCCFIGNHTTVPPTAAARSAMSTLLALLATRYDIDLAAGRTIRFTSRGSTRWPKGAIVVTDPVAAHRDMSLTACPGDAAYPLVRGPILTSAQRLQGAQVPTLAAAAPTATAPTASARAPRPAAQTPNGVSTTSPARAASDEGASPLIPTAGAGLVAVLGGAGAWAVRRYRMRAGHAPEVRDKP